MMIVIEQDYRHRRFLIWLKSHLVLMKSDAKLYSGAVMVK